jgi:hypothetical protein
MEQVVRSHHWSFLPFPSPSPKAPHTTDEKIIKRDENAFLSILMGLVSGLVDLQ